MVADPDLLLERAAVLDLPLTLNGDTLVPPGGRATLYLFRYISRGAGAAGVPNALYVVEMLQVAADRCQQGIRRTGYGPVQKSVLMEAGNEFVGTLNFSVTGPVLKPR
ncbi:MAG: hypothetical protein Ct9H300mP16_01210 [Pseudomonadota bacterium]|nr:MAG: hypothetical protein Ct9H300mP16_01210 [Pseudomonadota bacterium]